MSTCRARLLTLVLSLSLAVTGVAAVSARASADPPDGSGAVPDVPTPAARLFAGDPDDVPDPTGGPTGRRCSPAAAAPSWVAPGSGRTVALTFDDGPGPSTFAILHILQRYGVPATFFNIGVNEYYRPNEVLAQETLGFAVGNHTWDHPMMATLSAARQGAEMDLATNQTTALIHEPSCIFRPPYGNYNATTLQLAAARRMALWTWSVDTEDFKAPDASAAWVRHIVDLALTGGAQAHPVILMHNSGAGNPATVAALPTIIEYYLNRGYTFVDLLGRSGLTVASPAVAATPGAVHLFLRGYDGMLYMRSARNGAWGRYIPLGGYLIGSPAAVALNDSQLAVFVTSTRNNLWECIVNADGTGAAWYPVGGTVTSRPAAARSPDGTITIAVRGSDTAVWIADWRPVAGWRWALLGGSVASAPALAVTLGGELTVAAVGQDGAAWIRHHGSGWSEWASLGGVLTADPALCATADGRGLVLVDRSTDSATWAIIGDGTATTWGAWGSTGGRIISGYAGVAEGPSLNFFAYATDRAVWQALALDGNRLVPWPWPWQRIG